MRNIGLMMGVPVFVITVLAGVFNSQICVPCLALIGGAAAGYWAVQRLRPETPGLAARRGAQAGAIAGVGALLGHVVGGLLGAARLGPEGAYAQMADIMRELGAGPPPADLNPATYYTAAAVTSLCFGVFEVALMAGVGALAGVAAARMGQRGSPPARPA